MITAMEDKKTKRGELSMIADVTGVPFRTLIATRNGHRNNEAARRAFALWEQAMENFKKEFSNG